MDATKLKRQKRINRHRRVRAKIQGNKIRPKLSVFKSNKHIFLQLIDDGIGKTLASASSREIKEKGSKADHVKSVAALLVERATKAGVSAAVFDRGGYKFHGLLKIAVDQVREKGLKI